MSTDQLKEAYICVTCGKIGKIEHLCNPATKIEMICQFCGKNVEGLQHVCKEKIQRAQYFCNQCGRTAINDECLCVPEKIT